jgi:topoisomerase IA-like protein
VGLVAGDPLAGTIYEVFDLLMKHYALQERWKGGRAYIRRVVGDVVKTSRPKFVVGIDPETAVAIQTRRQRGYGHARRYEESAKPLLTVDAAVRWLATRGLPVSRETIYRWIREKKIHATQNKRKGIILDEKALQQAVALVRLYLSRSIGRERDGGSEEDI